MTAEKTIWVAMAVALLLNLAACEKDGPMEQAGEKVDNAIENAGDAIENAGDNVKDATD